MSTLINYIEKCLKLTNNYKSKLVPEILDMEGMSGIKTRHFYNNVCSFEEVRYLEIGTWKGSSICAAMCNNNMTCVCVDNWSEFDNVKDEFLENFNKFRGKNKATFIEKNYWDVDVSKLGKFNIYMFDGNHSEKSHYQALNHYFSCLDNEFIYLVDDWNWQDVKVGTLKSIKDNNCDILYKKEIFTNTQNQPEWGPGPNSRFGKDGDWHNGICIFVLKKKLHLTIKN
jgi:hypothetical protein